MLTYIQPSKNLETIKFSANAENTAYTLGTNPTIIQGIPDITFQEIAFIENPRLLWTNGHFFAQVDLSNVVTAEDFAPVESAAYSSIQQGTLGLINGQSLESGDINLDLTLVRIVDTLPTENIDDNKIYLVPNKNVSGGNSFDEYLHHTPETGDPFWELIDQFKEEIDLSEYLKKTDADKRYVQIGSGSSSGGSISISQTGAFNNYGNNGQAFNAVRDVGTTSITGKKINAASFGVKLDGTTAFSHKTYDTFNTKDGLYTGAKNTAVLTFSGQSGLRYAKNTGSASDVTADMYRYVGVIDSPDEAQRVYSAKQVDELLVTRDKEIAELKAALDKLLN